MDNGCGGKKDGTISEGLVRLDRSTQGRGVGVWSGYFSEVL